MTTDTRPKEAARRARRLHRRRHGEGLRDDPPEPRDDARGRDDRLPARAGRGARVPAACRRGSFNAISVDGECSTNDAVFLLANGASGIERTPATTRRSRRALGAVCADLAAQIVADGEGATVLAEIEVTGAGDAQQATAIARRIATSPLVKTALFGHDANWGRVLAAAGLGAVQRRLRRTSTRTASRSATTARRCSTAARRSDVEPDARRRRCTIELDLGLGDGQRELPDERPLLRLRPHQRGLPDMSPLVVKVGGAVAAERGRDLLAARRGHEVVRRARRRAADLRRDGAARPAGRVRRRAARDDAGRTRGRRASPSPR